MKNIVEGAGDTEWVPGLLWIERKNFGMFMEINRS